MIHQKLLIINKLGLHARAAVRLVRLVSAYASSVRIQYGNRTVDGKSIMSVMMLAAGKDSVITVTLEGRDERQAWNAISDLINSRFGETE